MLYSATINVMVKAARRAGRSLKRDLGEIEHLQVSLKGPANFVTKADKRYAAVRTATRKYVRHDDGFEELYDLMADPYELDNKVKDPRYASDAAMLRDLHDEDYSAEEEAAVAGRLEALGYL